MGENGVSIDSNNFSRRLKIFYDAWQRGGDTWGGSTAVAVPAGAASDELRYLKSVALQLWLFGYELPDTILVFTKDALHILTSSKKVSLLQPLCTAAKENTGIALTFHAKPKAEDGKAQIGALLEALRSSAPTPLVGVLAKEKPVSKLTDLWSALLAEAGLATADVSPGFGEVFAAKDQQEVQNIKKAAFLAATALKSFLVGRIETIIDEEKKVKHSRLSEQTEDVISNPAKIDVKLKPDNVDIAYPPVIQSGGSYDLRISAQSDDKPMGYDVIVCQLGARYSMYCASLARTFLVDPNKQQEAQYKALLAAQEAAVAALKPGQPISDAANAAIKALQDVGQGQLVEHLTKNLGFSMGIELRESSLLVTPKNAALVRPGMVFNLALGAADLKRTDADDKPQTYALLVGDTVLVRGEGEAPEVLTQHCSRAWKDIAYYFKDEGEGEEEEQEEAPAPRGPHIDGDKKLRSEDPTFLLQQQERHRQKTTQEELLERVNQETLRQLRAAEGEGGATPSGRKPSELLSYRSVNEVNPGQHLVVKVDQRAESVLFPIYGVMVPFHILTIKNATLNQDVEHSYIRVNFNFGTGFEPATRFPNAVFLKELSFRSADVRHAQQVVQEIKVLRSQVNNREKETAERATLVKQEKLQKSKGRIYTLPDVWIRPPFGGKGRKMTGQLEAHANGFHYSSPKQDEQLDIMYRNIKHAFLQPAEKEMITLVHFHLKDPIMVGKKKTKDVQFFTEVMESVQTLDVGRRSGYDPDELEEEQRERQMRNKINKQFQQYCNRVQQEIWERDFGELDLEFEVPFRELGFMGVPHKSTAFVMPTVNCLVELIEMPFTVVTLADINIVNLERVGFNLKNFDLAMVFKDLKRDVLRIDAIPSTSLDTVRQWLTSMDIKFYENKVNLNWKLLLKSIMEDPEGFIEEGGWSFLDAEQSDGEAEGEGEEEEDAEFAPSDDEEEEESSEEDDEDDDESVVESEDEDDEDASAEEDEEEGLDWDEMEEQAARADKEHGYSDDESDGKRKGKKRSGGGGGGGGGGGKRSRH